VQAGVCKWPIGDAEETPGRLGDGAVAAKAGDRVEDGSFRKGRVGGRRVERPVPIGLRAGVAAFCSKGVFVERKEVAVLVRRFSPLPE
jgi:hypothetical protein